MFQNLSKKEFIDLLKTHKSEVVYARMNLSDTGYTRAADMLYKISGDAKINPDAARVCIEARSNHLLFSDCSRLDFSSIKNCFRKGNVIFTASEFYDTFDREYKYNIISYIIAE